MHIGGYLLGSRQRTHTHPASAAVGSIDETGTIATNTNTIVRHFILSVIFRLGALSLLPPPARALHLGLCACVDGIAVIARPNRAAERHRSRSIYARAMQERVRLSPRRSYFIRNHSCELSIFDSLLRHFRATEARRRRNIPGEMPSARRKERGRGRQQRHARKYCQSNNN